MSDSVGPGLAPAGEQKAGRTSLRLVLLRCHLFCFSCRSC